MTETTHQETPAEHVRERYLGGSDAAAYMGVSKWRTPVQLWRDKTHEREQGKRDANRAKFFARRKRQEPIIAGMFADEFGIEVDRLSLDDNPNRYYDAENPFLCAEIDFEFRMSPSVRAAFAHRPEFCAIADGVTISGEIKTVHPLMAKEWGEVGSEDVPIDYASQAMHGLMVKPDRPACVVAALIGIDTLLCFPIMRDDALIAQMRARAVAFWHRHVIAGVPPDPLNMDDLGILWTLPNGKPVQLDEYTKDALERLESMRHQIASLEDEKTATEFEIGKFIAEQWRTELSVERDKQGRIKRLTLPNEDDHALMFYQGEQVGSWKRQRGTYLNQSALKEAHPAIIDEFQVEHFFRVMRAGKPKSTKRGKTP